MQNVLYNMTTDRQSQPLVDIGPKSWSFDTTSFLAAAAKFFKLLNDEED